MIERAALAAVAVVVFAWLAGGLHRARLESHGLRIAESGSLTAADVRRSADLLERAARHSSDTGPLEREAQLLLFARRPAPAAAVLERIVRREPENAAAWQLLARADELRDPLRARAARRRLAQLSPPPG